MDYELIILHTLVEIVMDEDASEHLKELRIAALNKVLRRLNASSGLYPASDNGDCGKEMQHDSKSCHPSGDKADPRPSLPQI